VRVECRALQHDPTMLSSCCKIQLEKDVVLLTALERRESVE
jgi:hypothetical protein